MEERWCNTCKRTLPINQFVLRNKSRSLTERVSNCKECRRARSKAWFSRNRDKACAYGRVYRQKHHARVLERDRQTRADRRIAVLRHYSNGVIACACCGVTELEFLTLDHVSENGSAHRKELQRLQSGRHTGWYIFKWLIENNFPEGYQVLCFNCNVGKHRSKTNQCPHYSLVQEHLGIPPNGSHRPNHAA